MVSNPLPPHWGGGEAEHDVLSCPNANIPFTLAPLLPSLTQRLGGDGDQSLGRSWANSMPCPPHGPQSEDLLGSSTLTATKSSKAQEGAYENPIRVRIDAPCSRDSLNHAHHRPPPGLVFETSAASLSPRGKENRTQDLFGCRLISEFDLHLEKGRV
ncbi:unnamed protein product [Arctogadus glacialis]